VPRLVEHFLSRYDRDPRRKTFAPDAMDALRRHHWPFNVRELQQAVERAVCLVDGDVVGLADLPDYLHAEGSSERPAGTAGGEGPPGPLKKAIEELERREIVRALEFTKGNKRRAMELLQLSPETFYRRLEEFGLHRKSE